MIPNPIMTTMFRELTDNRLIQTRDSMKINFSHNIVMIEDNMTLPYCHYEKAVIQVDQGHQAGEEEEEHCLLPETHNHHINFLSTKNNAHSNCVCIVHLCDYACTMFMCVPSYRFKLLTTTTKKQHLS